LLKQGALRHKEVNEFRGIKIGDKGYKISYNFAHSALHIFEGIVHEIYNYNEEIEHKDHSIILRSRVPCDEGHKLYMDSEGFDYIMLNGKCYPLSFGCCLYSDEISTCSFYAKDKKELGFIKAKLKEKAIDFVTKDFD